MPLGEGLSDFGWSQQPVMGHQREAGCHKPYLNKFSPSGRRSNSLSCGNMLSGFRRPQAGPGVRTLHGVERDRWVKRLGQEMPRALNMTDVILKCFPMRTFQMHLAAMMSSH